MATQHICDRCGKVLYNYEDSSPYPSWFQGKDLHNQKIQLGHAVSGVLVPDWVNDNAFSLVDSNVTAKNKCTDLCIECFAEYIQFILGFMEDCRAFMSNGRMMTNVEKIIADIDLAHRHIAAVDNRKAAISEKEKHWRVHDTCAILDNLLCTHKKYPYNRS